MPDTPKLAKAELRQLDANFDQEINQEKWTKVQFNPDSLKVSFANQVAQPAGGGDQNGPQAQQFVGAGSTKLAVLLVFDVTNEIPQDLPDTDDVRILTKRVAYFITPKGSPDDKKPKKYIPPSVRFAWGSFQFDGIMEAMEETLEFFSFEGKPLRATVSLTLTQQKITEFKPKEISSGPGVTRKAGKAPGTSPMNEAPAGSSLQSMASNSPNGSGADWQSIASFNGIENPRLMGAGTLIDFNPPDASIGASASVDLGVSLNVSIG
jgi:hypothetical protein